MTGQKLAQKSEQIGAKWSICASAPVLYPPSGGIQRGTKTGAAKNWRKSARGNQQRELAP